MPPPRGGHGPMVQLITCGAGAPWACLSDRADRLSKWHHRESREGWDLVGARLGRLLVEGGTWASPRERPSGHRPSGGTSAKSTIRSHRRRSAPCTASWQPLLQPVAGSQPRHQGCRSLAGPQPLAGRPQHLSPVAGEFPEGRSGAHHGLCPRARLALSVTERARLMQRIQPRRIAAMGCRAWGFMSGLRAGLWWWRTARERGAAAMVEGDSQCRPRRCSLGNEPLAGMARVPQGEQSLMRVGGCLKGNSQCPNHQNPIAYCM